MDSLAGYIATLCVGAVGTYLSQLLRPKIRIKYWQSHSFMYKIPKDQQNPTPALASSITLALPSGSQSNAQSGPAHFFLLTQSLTVQNFGRERAEWVEIVHVQRPDFFQLLPALNYTETTSATGEHTLRVESLASKEFFVIQFLCYTHMPALLHVRSNAGQGSLMPWMAVRKFPRWLYVILQISIVTGLAFFAYWLIKGGIFVLKGVGAL
jgi:hypothetical protein